MKRVAIVGGGPGGLFTAQILADKCGDLCQATIFEASDRLGGKLVTRTFKSAPMVLYEAGVAELYDYSQFGSDPVRELAERLGLLTVPMSGDTVILGDKILNTDGDIRRKLGPETLTAIDDFHDMCEREISAENYYESYWRDDNKHPWSTKTFGDILDTIPDETARRYIATAVHTDVAVSPHLTNAMNGAKNVLMDHDEYLRLYSIVGGNERLVQRLAETTAAEVVKNAPVSRVAKEGERYRLWYRHSGKTTHRDFDYVVFALPNYWLQNIDFDGRKLRTALDAHLAHYDHPAHYLRVSCLFKEPFWRSKVKGSYFMQDVFGGACLYDEASRHPGKKYGSLGWLIAGTAALAMTNLSDQQIIDRVIDSLPKPLAEGRDLLLEGYVQRWVGTVNALPGGNPAHDLLQRHRPEPSEHPGLLTVGDYIFDSTVNATYDSADFATDLIMTELRDQKYRPDGNELAPSAANAHALGADYHDAYAHDKTYEESYAEYFDENYNADLIKVIWGDKAPYKLLDVGSATGITIELFDRIGIECWGIENSAHIHARTLEKWKHRNFLGDVRNLPFENNAFDYVYDTCLCYLPDEDLDQAISELFRVVRKGVFFGGITSDMTKEVIEYHELFDGVQSLMTAWQWSERFMKNGFRMAINDPKVLKKVWRIECQSNEGDYPWYPDAKTMRMCFYSKPTGK
ncbi:MULTISPECIES: FAD-dependent oxidoreductase [unclassified Beijerinckia]|uniref:FAD-dependent oxidoreductase n=1 Tax=unclassified Beijerinckia TaxID=2638183 RepID=UPI0008993DED|nr:MULTISPECIES: FAD-dependent oxidoreductase [unclassified Beijerinckia]MDH7798378.1 SAM-dependent methyltransferase [Beijerinckia sp. GAS462]SED18904.1 Protoporphyrinogen oxidase [Beijerinckia sp. 28-YEA-48]